MDTKCPQCGRECLIVNVKRVYFGTCNHCKVGWLIGSNLLTVPQEEQDIWEANMLYLEQNFKNIT